MPAGAQVRASVVVPTRDRGSFVLEAVASALDSGVADEIIVVDAGSIDGSVESLRALGARIRLVEGPFRNAAASRNAGAAYARGRFLAFLDSDDLMLSAKVSCLAPILESDETIAVAQGRTLVIDEKGRPLEAATASRDADMLEASGRGTSYRDLTGRCTMFTSGTLMRRSAFEAVGGYDESLDAYEDWDLYLRLACRFRLVYAPCVTAKYRLWGGNVPWNRTAEWTARVAEKHLALLDAAGVSDPSSRYALLRRVAFSNHVLVRRRQSRAAALGALRIDPMRGLRDREVRRPLLRSFMPSTLLHWRRP